MTTLHHAPFFTLASSRKWAEAPGLEAQLSRRSSFLSLHCAWSLRPKGNQEPALMEAVLARRAGVSERGRQTS